MAETTHTRRVGFKLFLEGQEVDMVSFKLSAGIGTSAMMNVSIPANDYAHELKPRTVVHLFWYENKYELGVKQATFWNDAREELKETYTGNDRNPDLVKYMEDKASGVISQLTDYTDPLNWKLLFAGEVMGYGFSKIGGIRSISLTCVDFSSYWQAAQMYWGYKNASSDKKKKAIFVGATRLYQGGKTPVTTRDRLVQVLTSKPNGMLQPEGILGGLVSLLESATGVYNPGMNGKEHRGVNDLLSYAEMKYHLTRMVGASEKDKTASVFLNDKLFKKWLLRVGKSINQTASYMQLINALLPHIHYEWNSVTAPPFVPQQKNLATTEMKKIPTKYRGKGDIGELQKRCRKSWNTINSLEAKTRRNTKHLNKLPRNYDPVRDLPDLDAERKPKRNPEIKKTMTALTTGGSQLAPWKNAAALRRAGQAIRRELQKKAGGSSKLQRKASAVYAAFEYAAQAVELIEKLNGDNHLCTANNFQRIKRLLERARRGAGSGAGYTTKTEAGKMEEASSRLHMFLFRPDLYMSPPPKCNVLFPDMIQAIMYSRNWMSEVTRFWLSTVNSRGRDLKTMYFAPNTSILGDSDFKKSSEHAVKNRHSFHMKHERFIGIIPAFESISDWKAMQKAYKQQIADGGEKVFNQNDHLIRAANFMFFKKRYQGRSMRLTLRYSPQLIVGLPCLVLDPEEIANPKTERTADRRDRLRFVQDSDKKNESKITEKFKSNDTTSTGTHFIGVVASVEHVGDASGGAQTQVILTHVRTHREAGEIYGKEDDLENWTYRYVTRRASKGTIWTELKSKQGEHDVMDTTWSKYLKKGQYNSNAKYHASFVKDKHGKHVYGHFDEGWQSSTGKTAENHPRKDKGIVSSVQVPQQDAGSDDETVVNEYRIPKVKVRLWQYYKKAVKEKNSFSFEAIVTPPWYSKCFLPGNIGKEYYWEMLGCRSVVDDPAIQLNDKLASEHKNLLEAENEMEADEGNNVDVDMVRIFQGFQFLNEASGGEPDGKGGQTEYEPESTVSGDIYVPKSLLQRSKTTKYAAETLAETWMGLKRIGMNINMFIDGYVDRSYANMIDIFGNKNEYSLSETRGDLSGNLGDFDEWKDREGFHGYAYGPFKELDNLKGQGKRLVASDTSSKIRTSVANEIDTRTEKWQQVLAYRAALGHSTKSKS